jgi:hypothetical protein
VVLRPARRTANNVNQHELIELMRANQQAMRLAATILWINAITIIIASLIIIANVIIYH